MKQTKAIIVSIVFIIVALGKGIGQCYTNPTDPSDHEFPAPIYSNPQLIPENELLISNPSSDQLNPNLIHVVILGDGYNILNEEYSAASIYEVTNNDQLSTKIVDGQNIALFKLFDNTVTNFGLFNLLGTPLINFEGAGEANNVIDFMIGNADRNLAGITPYKEYKEYFKFYKVLYNSQQNGIGHPNADGSMNSTVACDEATVNAPANMSTFWGNELDFCNIHRAIKADYSKIECFIDKYFSALAAQEKVYVIVLSNTSHFGAAANIPKRICSSVANFSTEFEEHFVNCTNEIYNDYDERIAVHEFSHIFSKLQDEYFFPFESTNCVENLSESEFYSGPNRFWFDDETPTNVFPFTSSNEQIGSLPWNHWSTAPTQSPIIGNFKHGGLNQCTGLRDFVYTESVRKPVVGYENVPCNAIPSNSCLMENVLGPFCAVCREAIIERIHELVNPVNSFSPTNENLIPASSSVVFDLNLTVPNPNTVRVKWELVNSEGNELHLETDYNNATDENGNVEGGSNGVGGGAPGGFYRWHLDCEKFNEVGFDTPGDYTVRARIFDLTANSEGAGNRWVRHPQHEIDVDDETNGNHEEIREWTVHYGGISGTDLFAMDRSDDSGIEPYEANEVLWESPDIWACNDNSSACTEDEPLAYISNPTTVQVNVWVQNRGCKVFDHATDNGTVTFHWAKASTSLEWPISWNGAEFETDLLQGNEISQVNITENIDIANERVRISANWSLPDPSAYDDYFGGVDFTHFCLLARINSDNDLLNEVTEGPYPLYTNVMHNNNIVWKNFTIIDKFDGITGQTSSDDVVLGGSVIVGNNSTTNANFKLQFQVPAYETGKPITEEAEVRIILSDSLWGKWIDGGQ